MKKLNNATEKKKIKKSRAQKKPKVVPFDEIHVFLLEKPKVVPFDFAIKKKCSFSFKFLNNATEKKNLKKSRAQKKKNN